MQSAYEYYFEQGLRVLELNNTLKKKILRFKCYNRYYENTSLHSHKGIGKPFPKGKTHTQTLKLNRNEVFTL
jgi:hypothetical protein